MTTEQFVRLADVTTLISSGSTPTGGAEVYTRQGPVLFIRSQNVRMNKLALDDVAFVNDQIDRAMARSRVRQGDVLLNITGASIGRVATFGLSGQRANVNQHVCVIRPIVDRLSPRYVTHLIASPSFQREIDRLQHGGTRQALTFGQIADFKIPLVALTEQRRIADILDRADALRAKRRKAIELLDALDGAVFASLFGDPSRESRWPMGTVGDVLASASYGTSKKAGSGGAYPVLRMGNITSDGKMDLAELKHMNLDEAGVERFTVRPGDLLFNRTNSKELVGKTAVYRSARLMAYAGYLIRLRTSERATPDYLCAYLNCPHGKATLRGMCKSIVGMANISATELRGIRIQIPPIALQDEFTRQIAATDKLRTAHCASLAEMDALFASLQHRAFRGEL